MIPPIRVPITTAEDAVNLITISDVVSAAPHASTEHQTENMSRSDTYRRDIRRPRHESPRAVQYVPEH